jgi:transcriptional regulator with XRE-family HTH domain
MLMLVAKDNREAMFSERSRGFLAWLRQAMRDEGFGESQSKLATYIGTGPATVNGWFRRGALPRYEMCLTLAHVLHRTPEEVLAAAGYEPRTEAARIEAQLPPWLTRLLAELTEDELRVTSNGTFSSAVPEVCCHFSETSTFRSGDLLATTSTRCRRPPSFVPMYCCVCTAYPPRFNEGRTICSRTQPVLVFRPPVA